jgi:hypothetical protein
MNVEHFLGLCRAAKVLVRKLYKSSNDIDLIGSIRQYFRDNKVNISYPQACEFVSDEIEDMLTAHAQA